MAFHQVAPEGLRRAADAERRFTIRCIHNAPAVFGQALTAAFDCSHLPTDLPTDLR